MVDSPSRAGASIKSTGRGGTLKSLTSMSDINQNKCSDNDLNGAGAYSEGASSGRSPVVEQHRPGRQYATARVKWSKEVNKVVIECYLRSRPVNENGVPIRGYRQRMFRVWQEIGLFEATEQRICDQARAK